MSNQPPSDVTGGASTTSALVSLVSLILAFLNANHVWLQNLTLLVSLGAGLFAISAGLIKLIKMIKSLFVK
jgi:hypothetical protein